MRLHAGLLAVAAVTLAACGPQRDDDGQAAIDTGAATAVEVRPADEPDPSQAPGTTPVEGAGAGAGIGALRVDLPAPGTVGFEGFGPARFGDSAEAVRQAWGGDLGDVRPPEPGGCHYLIPQPLGEDGYRVAFMVEGGRFVRMDVRDPTVIAPGGARVGMAGDEVRALYRERLSEHPHKYDPDGRVLRVAAPDGGSGALVLELDAAGQVDEWRVGIPPQVDYVEGCS